MPVPRAIPILVLCTLAAPVRAEQGHDALHGGVEAPSAAPSEPGQGAFAALSEIVALLESDPATDWSRVDIDALRAHLVDMDLLATRAVAAVERLPNGLSASATGDAKTVAALGRMVPAHAAQLAADPAWTAVGEMTGDGAILTVTSSDPATVARIHALGFFGLMASQDHHRAHHLSIAKGGAPHGR